MQRQLQGEFQKERGAGEEEEKNVTALSTSGVTSFLTGFTVRIRPESYGVCLPPPLSHRSLKKSDLGLQRFH